MRLEPIERLELDPAAGARAKPRRLVRSLGVGLQVEATFEVVLLLRLLAATDLAAEGGLLAAGFHRNHHCMHHFSDRRRVRPERWLRLRRQRLARMLLRPPLGLLLRPALVVS